MYTIGLFRDNFVSTSSFVPIILFQYMHIKARDIIGSRKVTRSFGCHYLFFSENGMLEKELSLTLLL